ncbi:hypothetical protein BDR07DRAFT_770463, partial [Suillus spraguei]
MNLSMYAKYYLTGEYTCNHYINSVSDTPATRTTQDATTNAKASAIQNLIIFALQVKKKRAQIRLRRQRRLESLTGHEFNSSDCVLENGPGDSSFSDFNSNTSMSMSSDSGSPTTGSLSSTFESDTNEPSDNSSVYSDPSSLWVKAHSCRAWRDGWCLVDGTLMTVLIGTEKSTLTESQTIL